ncbi:oligopeptide transport system permease protein OppC [Lachnospiraceae bacterium KM106-2]|nr:oligopeptide transport system permease protein OppC [Lachnospiraceae bacterium KM106-2]
MSKKKNKRSTFGSVFRRMFLGNRAIEKEDVLAEEQVKTPFQTAVKNYVSNKFAMGCLIVFTLLFVTCFIGSIFINEEPTYQEVTQQNLGPTRSLLDIPSRLVGNVRQISVGSTYGVGIDNEGVVYMWGSLTDKLKQIPNDMGDVVQVAAGQDHCLALNKEGKVFTWGNNRLHLGTIPLEVANANNIKYINAGYQISIAVTEDGKVYAWGNTNVVSFDVHDYQGKIAKAVATGSGIMGLTKDGEVVSLTGTDTGFTKIPTDLGKVKDIEATAQTVAAITEDGKVRVWGNTTKGLDKIPEIEGKAVSLSSGRYHYVVVTDQNKVYAWGDNNFKESNVPSSIQGKDIDKVYSGYYQNYAVMKDGSVKTWGLKGYWLGTDQYGRDVLTRIINGGRMTMTIGAIAVIISIIIGVTIGGIAGYYGGKVDIILMRFEEVVAGIPFLPFAMILSGIVGNKISETQRIMLIMVILGFLSWPSICYLVRAEILSEREKEYVTAAKALGVKESKIIFRHILPNIMSVIIVNATLQFAIAMLTESTLSYLGFGVAEPNATWGNMLNGCCNSVVIQSFWWRWVFPSIALGMATICINAIGDGLRDAFDPKANER